MGPITPTTKGRVNINNGTIHYNPKDHQRTAQTGKHSQLYLRVITIADLTDPKSSTIPYGMLTGDWQAGSDLLWPDISCPPKQYWATFRKCIRATFSTLAPKYQPSHFSIRLDRMLRPWHAVPCPGRLLGHRGAWLEERFPNMNEGNEITIKWI
jgi:hypothetical protein